MNLRRMASASRAACTGPSIVSSMTRLCAAFVAGRGSGFCNVITPRLYVRARGCLLVSFLSPAADRTTCPVTTSTSAVGVFSSHHDRNSPLPAGRAALCAPGRAHLFDPSWTLHAAAEQDYDGLGARWPLPWQAGRRRPQTGRTDG